MDKPKTNREAYELVLQTVGSQSELARRLGVVKQLISRWDEAPLQFAEQIADLVNVPIDWIIPETTTKIEKLISDYGHYDGSVDQILPGLIRIFIRPAKSGAWVKKPRKRK